MEKKKIFLSPSAQEYNIGYGDFGSEEYRMNRITDKLEPLLVDKGYTVYRNNPNDSLSQIVRQSNSLNPDIHVSIHSNASGGNSIGRGPEIYVNRLGTRAEKLAQSIYDEIIKIYPNPEYGRGVLANSGLYEVRETIAPAALLEIAFHDNPEDAIWIINNEDKIAQAIADGIENYFNNI